MSFLLPYRFLLILLFFIFYFPLYSIVDMRSANYSNSWTDIEVPGTGFNLTITRSYNSRSLFDGIFGFGWCSDYETTLDVAPDGTLAVVECGSGLRVSYRPENYKKEEYDRAVQNILNKIKRDKKGMTPSQLNLIKNKITSSDHYFEFYAKSHNVAVKRVKASRFFANGKKNDYIIIQKNMYVRRLSDGSYQKFNQQGKLIYFYDRNRNNIKLSWKGKRLLSVTDNNGRQLIFSHDGVSHRIASIKGPSRIKTSYKYKKENLILAIDAYRQKHQYTYDSLHNMTSYTRPDKKSIKITYNKNKDWVTSFKDFEGCLETYKYILDPKDPDNHYSSTVKKVCKGKIVNNSSYEFWYRKKANKIGSYLHRAKSVVNGKITDVVYHPIFGRPVSISKDKSITQYLYYSSGLVKEKLEPFQTTLFEYKNSCIKISKINVKTFRENRRGVASKKKLVKNVTTDFYYHKTKCTLTRANSSDGLKVNLKYDTKGRIILIKDQAKKVVKIRYDDNVSKPSFIHRPGLGSINITYDNRGEIKKIKSKEGPQVAIQVANVFNNLLELIEPATSEGSI